MFSPLKEFEIIIRKRRILYKFDHMNEEEKDKKEKKKERKIKVETD